MDAGQTIKLIQIEYQKGNTETALSYAIDLEKELEKHPVSPEYAMCLFLLGRILVDKNAFAEAEPRLLNCQKIFAAINLTHNHVYLMAGLALGDLYFKNQQNDLAWKHYSEVEQSETFGNDIGVKTKVYHKYAVLSERYRKYEEAINWYEAYLDAFSKMHNKQAGNYIEFYRYKEKLKLALRAKKANYKGDMMDTSFMISGTFPEGGAALMDIQFAKYLVSDLPDPKNTDLKEIIAKAEKVIIHGKEILEISDKNIIAGLEKLFLIEEMDYGHLMKQGTITFKFIGKTDEVIARIDYLEDHFVRWMDRWKPDTKLINGEEFELWLSIKNMK